MARAIKKKEEATLVGDKYSRRRNRKARRQKRGKKQKGSKGCYQGKYGMTCPGDEGYDESMVTV